jgi:hypothetical protein
MVTVGIIGDFDPDSETHRATNDALQEASHALAIPVSVFGFPRSHSVMERWKIRLRLLMHCGLRLVARIEAWRVSCAGFALLVKRDGPSLAPEAASNMLWWSMRETLSTSMTQTMKRVHLKPQPC